MLKSKKSSFYIALAVAFIDLMGVGMIYPLFSPLLFDKSFDILPSGTSNEMRGLYLGILIALTPLMQFFSAPIWGALSDHYGRKKPLLWSQSIGFLGYLIGVFGIIFHNIYLLFLLRLIVGVGSGILAFVQASVADIRAPEQKAKNFGLYSMALGTGFAFGPLMSGLLFAWSHTAPFWASVAMVGINLLFTFLLFQETLLTCITKAISWKAGFVQLKKVFQMKGIQAIVLAYFLHNFAWCYFFEFSPVYLIKELHFSSSDLGFYYGIMGGTYALSTGLLIRPFVRKFKPEILFFAGILLAAITILILPYAGQGIWAFLIPLCFFIAFLAPTCTTMVSNQASSHIQGEALGVLSAIPAAAYIISPLCAASFVGKHPVWVFWIGGISMLMGASIVLAAYRTKLFK